MITLAHTTDTTSDVYQDALSIRVKVFVDEQQVPKELEIEDEEICLHCVLYEDSVPMGTVRLYPTKKGQAKIQRMAVLKEARGKKYGQQLIHYIEEEARKMHVDTLILGAQLQAQGFYDSLGFTPYGDIFDDAGIPHIMMTKNIK